jgi:hypothetical protein
LSIDKLFVKVLTILSLRGKTLYRHIGEKVLSETQSLRLAGIIEKLPIFGHNVGEHIPSHQLE